jgi:hypothetical protein
LDSLNNGGDYLILWLQDGLLKARADAGGPTPLETTIGSHLNDIELHWLRIRHYDKQFAFYLDDLPLQYLTYDLNLQFDTRSNVFIGGLPASYTADYEPVTALAPLSGCVEDVRFAEDSISPHSLESRAPITEHELLDGCVDRCIDAECNDGECVTSWSIPSGYFCDCSEAARVGESCTTAPRNYQLSLTGDTYYCYTLRHQPFTARHDDIVVQLQSPIPPTGTILTGHSENRTNQFILYLKDNAVHYELLIENTEYSAISTAVLATNNNYRISISRLQDDVTLRVQSASSTNQIALIDTVVLQLSDEILFPFVCVGGGEMEIPAYSGTLERVFLGHIALLELNSTNITQKQETTNVIHLLDNPVHPPLTFTRHGLQSDEVSFEFRIPRDHKAGVLLYAGNSTIQFKIFVIAGEILLFADSALNFMPCDNILVLDNNWHYFHLRKLDDPSSEEGPGVVLTIDYDTQHECRFFNAKFRDIFDAEPSVFQLGPSTTNQIESDVTSTPFLGCFQNIEFSTGSEIFRPNLEVPIAQHERFTGDGCFLCDPIVPNECLNGGTCHNTRPLQNVSCSCPEPFRGPNCEQSPSTNTPSPPPPETTPTNDPSTDSIDYDALGQWVGIATAITLVLILFVVLLVLIGCFAHSQRIKGLGFYRTNENRSSVTLPHFSASLKTAHSHTLNLEQNRITAITNGHTVHPTYTSGEKEFYI